MKITGLHETLYNIKKDYIHNKTYLIMFSNAILDVEMTSIKAARFNRPRKLLNPLDVENRDWTGRWILLKEKGEYIFYMSKIPISSKESAWLLFWIIHILTAFFIPLKCWVFLKIHVLVVRLLNHTSKIATK